VPRMSDLIVAIVQHESLISGTHHPCLRIRAALTTHTTDCYRSNQLDRREKNGFMACH
jgi:hypothetical protein